MLQHQIITNEDGPYLHRYFLTETIALHIFLRPDGDRVFHDHPHDFSTLVLWGGYEEESHILGDRWTKCIDGKWHEMPSGKTKKDRLGFLSFRHRKAEHAHRITKLRAKRVVTLVFRGKKRRDWGFWIPPKSIHRDIANTTSEWKWVLWRDYLNEH